MRRKESRDIMLIFSFRQIKKYFIDNIDKLRNTVLNIVFKKFRKLS